MGIQDFDRELRQLDFGEFGEAMQRFSLKTADTTRDIVDLEQVDELFPGLRDSVGNFGQALYEEGMSSADVGVAVRGMLIVFMAFNEMAKADGANSTTPMPDV